MHGGFLSSSLLNAPRKKHPIVPPLDSRAILLSAGRSETASTSEYLKASSNAESSNSYSTTLLSSTTPHPIENDKPRDSSVRKRLIMPPLPFNVEETIPFYGDKQKEEITQPSLEHRRSSDKLDGTQPSNTRRAKPPAFLPVDPDAVHPFHSSSTPLPTADPSSSSSISPHTLATTPSYSGGYSLRSFPQSRTTQYSAMELSMGSHLSPEEQAMRIFQRHASARPPPLDPSVFRNVLWFHTDTPSPSLSPLTPPSPFPLTPPRHPSSSLRQSPASHNSHNSPYSSPFFEPQMVGLSPFGRQLTDNVVPEDLSLSPFKRPSVGVSSYHSPPVLYHSPPTGEHPKCSPPLKSSRPPAAPSPSSALSTKSPPFHSGVPKHLFVPVDTDHVFPFPDPNDSHGLQKKE